MDQSIGLTKAISEQEWLKPAEEALQNALHHAFESGGELGQRAKNSLNGTWLGEPLHVILTDIPLGAWTSAMVFDAAAGISEKESMDSAADASIAVGLVGAIGAAVTGLTDWQDIDPPARRIGLVHGLMNLTAAALMGISLVKRRNEKRSTGRALGLLGFLTAAAAARLGGDLVYKHRVGVDHSVEKELPRDFRPAVTAADLQENQPVSVKIDETPIVLVNSGGKIFALAETCSHLGGPLSEGKVENGTIQCPWHGSRFNLEDGCVVNGPAVHAQPCLEVRINEGQVELRRRTQ